MASIGSSVEIDKIPVQYEYKNALMGDIDIYQKIKLGELNELAYEDHNFSKNTNFSEDGMQKVWCFQRETIKFDEIDM